MIPFPITRKGYEQLELEIKQLKHEERPKIVEAIATAREFGDLSENAEYHSAKEKQGFIEGRILDLEDKYARAQIIDVSKLSNDTVKFGAKVTLVDDETDEKISYHIVSEYETDTLNRKISLISPVAKALIGKSINDTVEVYLPKGTKFYKIIDIKHQ